MPVGAGTDATRVASYNPWVSLSWLVTGKTRRRPARSTRRRTASTARPRCGSGPKRNTWFSNEEGKKGQIKPGQLADLAVLSADYFSVPEDEIQDIESVLTVVGGKVVHGAGDFGSLAPPLAPPMPDWSPVRRFGGYHRRDDGSLARQHVFAAAACACPSTCGVHGHAHGKAHAAAIGERDQPAFWGALGCSCWAF